jgi:hypothetical protein
MDFPVFNGPRWLICGDRPSTRDGAYSPVGAPASVKFYFPVLAADYKLFGGDPNMWAGIKNAYQFSVYNSPTSFVTMKRPANRRREGVDDEFGITALDSLDLYDPSKIRSYPWQSEFKQTGDNQFSKYYSNAGSDRSGQVSVDLISITKGIDPGQDYKRFTVGNNTEFKPAKIPYVLAIAYLIQTVFRIYPEYMARLRV